MRARMAAAHQKSVEARLAAAIPADLTATERTRVEPSFQCSGGTRHFHQEPTDFHYPGLPEIEFHDRGFSRTPSIEAQPTSSAPNSKR